MKMTRASEGGLAMEQGQITQAARLLRQAQRGVALTGAGISTPSGVPDFRSDSGIWRGHDPFEIAGLASFRRDPQHFFRWFQPLLGQLIKAQPNPAHRALAQLEQRGMLRAVITQNIDGLHQRAGSREVYELHGNLRSATCTECEEQVPGERVIASIQKGHVLRCRCGGIYKPDIVLFDELLPRGLFWLAQRAIDHADVVVVAGSSLEVAPVCDLPLAAQRRGASVIIVNLSPTYLDAHADVVLRADVAEALPAIVEEAKAL
jgi:NAD-dependent deacetylase